MTRHTPLSLLAEFGPLTRECIATCLDLPWVCVVENVAKLKRQGFAVEASPTRWEVTPAGRALAEMEATEAEAEQAASTSVPSPITGWRSFPYFLRRLAC